MSVRLRPVTAMDRDLIFTWRNDPFLVERSSSKRKVLREEHDAWFGELLGNPKILAFVVELDGQPCGQVRLELKDVHCVITAYLVPAATGKGYGVDAIRAGCMAAAARWSNVPILACVREDNKAGLSGFRKAGFCRVCDGCPAGHVAMVLAEREEAEVIGRYTNLIQIHGDSHLSLDWGSQQGQHLRFRVLAEVGDLNGRRILDVGCGLGDFAAWLTANGIETDYTGLDITPAMIKRARTLHPTLAFHQGSISDPSTLSGHRFDFVLGSGIFTTYSGGGMSRMADCVKRMWDLATEGIAFNSLSTWALDRDPGEFHADPARALAVARNLSTRVTLRHDYHPRDFTIYIYRSGRE